MQDKNFNAAINLLPYDDLHTLKSKVKLLKRANGRRKKALCQEFRDELLKKHADVNTLFARQLTSRIPKLGYSARLKSWRLVPGYG